MFLVSFSRREYRGGQGKLESGPSDPPRAEEQSPRLVVKFHEESIPVSDSRSEPPILHVHGSRFPHDPVEIFGTTPALQRLINALIDAVHEGQGRCEFHGRDGYESEVRANCLDGPRREEDWRRSGSPYLDVDDPVVARIIDLTDENERLRQTINLLRVNRPAIVPVDMRESPGNPFPPS
ncbi:MAG: hypothetical protein NVSMB9_29520 [Isosphaeraceae bacterium]